MKQKVKVKTSKKAPSKAATSKPSTSAAGALQGGVAKRKHGLAKRQHALLPQLSAAAPETKKPESAKEKKRRKRSAKSAILGAVDGMRSSLDELLEENERKHREQAPGDGVAEKAHVITSKKRQKLVADETEHMKQVIEHPSFVADPFAALQEHLANTIHGGSDSTRGGKKHKKKQNSS